MKVEIWSDVMCPFCYIGKRKFEAALAGFPRSGEIEVEWKSFQLNPDLKAQENKSINEYLAEVKGWSLDQAKQMNARVSQMAQAAGLLFNFDKAVVANSFDAHRLSHMARNGGLQDQVEERLFAAYFTKGMNTADHEILVQIGQDSGLDPAAVRTMLAGDEYSADVRHDIEEAARLGIRGVPFFVLDRKIGVSGAQDSAVFLEALSKAFEED